MAGDEGLRVRICEVAWECSSVGGTVPVGRGD